jgi:ABC-type uncharacterized transport system ATPase subunit
LKAFIEAHKPRLGLVSLETPLISNLSVWSNIALIPQYHQNMPLRAAKAMTQALLQRLGVASIAEKRNPALTTEERFCAMLLRAAILVLDRPFSLLTNLRNGRFILDTLGKIDDLIAEIYIFDYNWDKERYGISNDKEY